MEIQFLQARKESNLNRDNVVTIKQEEIESLQDEIAAKENKLNEMNKEYFKILNNKNKLAEYNNLKDEVVASKVKLEATKEELSLFESSFKFEYDVNKIVSELREQAEKAELNKKIQSIEKKLEEARKEAESLAEELFEYDGLIVNTVNVYKTNVSESNADLNKINEAKQVIYDFHNSPIAYLVEKYPTYYYSRKDCIFK